MSLRGGLRLDQVGSLVAGQSVPFPAIFTFPVNPQPGATVIVWVATYTRVMGTVTDNAGGAFTLDAENILQGTHPYLYHRHNISLPPSGPYQVSVPAGSAGGGSWLSGGAVSYTGVKDKPPLAVNMTGPASSAGILRSGQVYSPAPVTLFAAIAGYHYSGTAQLTAGNGFTNRMTNWPQITAAFADMTGTGTAEATWTTSTGTVAYGTCIAAYEAEAPPPGAKVWTDSGWAEGALKGWTGTAWRPWKTWDGSAWRELGVMLCNLFLCGLIHGVRLRDRLHRVGTRWTLPRRKPVT